MKWSKAMLVEGKDTLLGVKNSFFFSSYLIQDCFLSFWFKSRRIDGFIVNPTIMETW